MKEACDRVSSQCSRYTSQKVVIAGLQLTSRQSCWGTRTKRFPPLGTKLVYHANSAKKLVFYCFDHQHGRLVTWLQAINTQD